MALTTCKLCNKQDNPENYVVDEIRLIMETRHVCFNCAFWLWQKALDDSGQRRFAIANGQHYVLDKENTNAYFKGSGGHTYVFHFNDGTTVSCSNVWHQGTIPEHLRILFPDNATIQA